MSQADVTAAMMMGGMYGPNPYSQFQGRIPLPGYAGTPTDAMGNPIQPPPGVTLNSPRYDFVRGVLAVDTMTASRISMSSFW